jgi:signal peptidase II
VRENRTRAWWLAGALGAGILALDQLAKAVVEDHIVPGERVDLAGPLRLTLSHNQGVAFGLAGGGGLGLIILTLAALGLVSVLFARNPTRQGMWVAFGLIAGGALGNLIDRLRAGAVTDFIDLPHWPTFNLADISITVGVILLALIYMREIEN